MSDFDAFADFMPEDGEEITADLDTLRDKANEAKELEAVIEGIEEELSQFKARHRFLTERQIPAIMSELGMNKFELLDGTKVQVKEFVSGSLNKAPDQDWARAWVKDNGGADLFKTEVSVSFDKGGHNQALSLKAELESEGFEPKLTDGIHAQTFMSFGREKMTEYKEALERGENVEEPPFEKIGLYAGRKAALTVPKKKGK